MAGLKRVIDQNKFRRKAEKAADKLDMGYVSDWQVESTADDAYEDDGTLHIERYGLHIAVGFGEDTAAGSKANEQIRGMMAAVGLKRKIGKRVLVEEECEACDGDGFTDCDCCGQSVGCGECDGKGFTTPDDYV